MKSVRYSVIALALLCSTFAFAQKAKKNNKKER